MCHGDSWTKALPLVLLGMRSAFKADLKTTSAELVYGETLRLPGEIVVAVPEPPGSQDLVDFVSQLRQHMSNVRPVPASRHSQPKSFLFKDLDESSHVLLRDDTVRRPLQPPYTGPYKVLQRAADKKTVTIDFKGKPVVVTMDRVKPYFQEDTSHLSSDCPIPDSPADCPVPVPVPEVPQNHDYRTRSGRTVRFTKPFDL